MGSRFQIGTLLLCVYGFAAADQTRPDAIPVSYAREVIQFYLDDLETMRVQLDSRYNYDAAGGTLDELFARSGVGYTRRYARDWGGWLYTTWDNVALYEIHAGNLKSSLAVIEEQGFTIHDQMFFLRYGMDLLHSEHDELLARMDRYTRMFVERALILDKIEAASGEDRASVELEYRPKLAAIEEMTEDFKTEEILPYRDREVFGALTRDCFMIPAYGQRFGVAEEGSGKPGKCGGSP